MLSPKRYFRTLWPHQRIDSENQVAEPSDARIRQTFGYRDEQLLIALGISAKALFGRSRDLPGRHVPVVALPGGPARTVGTYSSICSRPSKVRLPTMSRETSGYAS